MATIAVNGKELKKLLRHASIFINSAEYIWLWTEENSLCVFSINGYVAFLSKIDKKLEDHLAPVAISKDDLKSINTAIDTFGLIEITTETGMVKLGNKSKVEVTNHTASQTGKEQLAILRKRFVTPIDYIIPQKGIRIPTECFSKVFSIFQKSDSPIMQCLVTKEQPDISAPCFYITHNNIEIWCMSCKQGVD